ncbi:MAG: cytochrome C [Desulfuromonas sp.]|nr:MAG: cytochrome C [Desulfuromonas sp.]
MTRLSPANVSSLGLCLLLFLFLLPTLCVAADSCSTGACHADMSGVKFGHMPVADGECSSCHEQILEAHPVAEGKSFRLVEQGAALCYQCHDSYGKMLTVHPPVADGECTFCHNPHGSNAGPKLLPVADDLKELCTQCHDEGMFNQQFVHGPAASGACTQCHNPHQANQPRLLKKSVRNTCTGCHTDIGDGLATAPVIHAAVEEASCLTCHNPHSAPAAKLLQKDVESVCLECHGDVGRKAQRAKVKHAALYREEKCTGCHTAHFSNNDGLLFLKEQDVCFTCHGKNDYHKSNALKNIAAQVEGKPYLHGPLEDGQCSACHQPHGSDYFRMLNGPYPETFYYPYTSGSYDFCLGCHDSNMLRFESTSIYTEFRNGKQNLHFLHVANQYKGRTCRACHEPHASNIDKLMNEVGAEFGEWNVPVRFNKTETGGSCSPGCHQNYAYDRENPVSYER